MKDPEFWKDGKKYKVKLIGEFIGKYIETPFAGSDDFSFYVEKPGGGMIVRVDIMAIDKVEEVKEPLGSLREEAD